MRLTRSCKSHLSQASHLITQEAQGVIVSPAPDCGPRRRWQRASGATGHTTVWWNFLSAQGLVHIYGELIEKGLRGSGKAKNCLQSGANWWHNEEEEESTSEGADF